VGEPPLAIWIGIFLIGVIIGRWWFSIVAGVGVFVVIAVASDPEAGSVEVGFIAGVAVFLVTLCAILLRSFVVGIVKDELARRR